MLIAVIGCRNFSDQRGESRDALARKCKKGVGRKPWAAFGERLLLGLNAMEAGTNTETPSFNQQLAALETAEGS